MKIIFILSIIVALIAGYLFGSFFPIKGFFPSESPSIAGDSTLKITVLRPDKTPATGLEVDVSNTQGQVLEGGHELTNSNGVATFKIKPDTYSIFFNANNFPSNLTYPPTQVTTTSGQTSTQIIILEAK